MDNDEKVIINGKHLVCPVCHHPFYSNGPYPNKGNDENGEYLECKVCHNKCYINKEN